MAVSAFIPEIGGIYHMYFDQNDGIKLKPGETSHPKFFIVLGIDSVGNAIGFVLINSLISPGLKQYIKDAHREISCSDYSFLNYNSFVDCSDLMVMQGPRFQSSKRRGKCAQLSEKDYNEFVNTIKSITTIEPKKLIRFGLLVNASD